MIYIYMYSVCIDIMETMMTLQAVRPTSPQFQPRRRCLHLEVAIGNHGFSHEDHGLFLDMFPETNPLIL